MHQIAIFYCFFQTDFLSKKTGNLCKVAGRQSPKKQILVKNHVLRISVKDMDLIGIQRKPHGVAPVSYTHLDVYKRQGHNRQYGPRGHAG